MLIYRIGSDENLLLRTHSFSTLENIQAFFNDKERKWRYQFKKDFQSGWWNYGRKHYGTLKRRLRSLKMDILHLTKCRQTALTRIAKIWKHFYSRWMQWREKIELSWTSRQKFLFIKIFLSTDGQANQLKDIRNSSHCCGQFKSYIQTTVIVTESHIRVKHS